ncbi:MAG: xanthine dehydrogenase family protein molybdopterin-binding subunit, partial [Dehalococcoidia bacterium]
VRIDAARARAYPGVAVVITGRDLPNYNANPTSRRHATLPKAEVLFHGQPVAAVLAEDPVVAEEAAELVAVEYEELPEVLDPLVAMAEGSPLARQPLTEIDRSEERGHITLDVSGEEAEGKPTNISSQIRFARGDVEKGLAEADVVVERTWRSGMVHQGYIEPHVTIADYDINGDLTIWSSTQAPFYVRDEVSTVLGIPEKRIRVIATEVGGGFGGKNFLEQMLAAALAVQMRRPVKLVMSRKEDMLAAMPAPQVVVELKTGMKRDGTLVALRARLIYDSGAYPGAPVVQGCMYIGGYYRCPNIEIQGYEVLTNKVSVGALRAPGTHNATWAMECHMDMMARELGLDPLEVRLKNAVGAGDPLPSGAPYPSIGLRQVLERVAESPIWRQRQAAKGSDRKLRGVGLAVGGWQGGLQPASAIVALNADGTVNVTIGASDITGVRTSFAQMAAEELRLPMEKVSVVSGDTRTAPYAGMSAGSKITFTVGRAVKQAAEDARRQMLEIAADRLEADSSDLELVEGRVQVKGDPERAVTLEQMGQMTTAFAARYAPVVGRGS